eukprot:3762728-Prymnesium_polylepis.4
MGDHDQQTRSASKTYRRLMTRHQRAETDNGNKTEDAAKRIQQEEMGHCKDVEAGTQGGMTNQLRILH